MTHRAENTLTVSAAVGPGPPDINPASLSAAAAAVTPELVAEEATGSSGYLLPVHSGVQRTNRAVCRCQISKVAHEAEADVRKAPSGTPPELREARQLEKSEEPRRAESHRKSTRRKSRRCARSSEAAEHQTRQNFCCHRGSPSLRVPHSRRPLHKCPLPSLKDEFPPGGGGVKREGGRAVSRIL